jgi:L-alanine-DL-glutamate epimerase-like enolase superfamily enzyme
MRTLEFRRPFRVSRSVATETRVVDVEIRHEGVSGFGEATPSRRYGVSAEETLEWAESSAGLLGDDPFALEDIGFRLTDAGRPTVVRAALDAALHDLCGKLVGLPVWRLLGLPSAGPPTSWSIGIGDPDEMARQAAEAISRFRCLKIKLGARDGLDVERVRAVRRVTDCPLRVDVNEYWTLDEALDHLPRLADLGVEYCEQPLKAGDPDAVDLRRKSPVPIYLDEECLTPADVARSAERAHGINVKLEECGGIREAIGMVRTARALGLRTMLGCNAASALGIAPEAHIAGLFDHVDLDGNLLIADDPWRGVDFVDGHQLPSRRPGLGVEPEAA